MAKAQDEETSHGDVTLRVVVAEDQPIMRAALVELLAKDPHFDIVADAGDGAEAERLARQMSPDVLVTDLDMPVQDGVATIASLTQDTPVRCLTLSTFGSEEWVLSALRAGASGYVVKHSEPEDIRAAVRACAAGEMTVSPQVVSLLVDQICNESPASRRPPLHDPAEDGQPPALTPRESDVLACLAGGMNNQEIADELHLSVGAVKLYLSKACDRLGARDRVQLLVRGTELGLIQPSLANPETGLARFQ